MTHEAINEGAMQAVAQEGEVVTQTGSIRNLGTIEGEIVHKIAYMLPGRSIMRRTSHREADIAFRAPVKPKAEEFQQLTPESLTGGIVFNGLSEGAEV